MWVHLRAEAALALADVTAARQWADEAVSVATGWYRVLALTTRARVAIAQGETEQAERDAHEGRLRSYGVPRLPPDVRVSTARGDPRAREPVAEPRDLLRAPAHEEALPGGDMHRP